jgi:hypothetical protein
LVRKSIGAEEIRAHAHRPGHRRGVQRQVGLDLVQKLEGMTALAVNLVDERDDGDVAQPADLEELRVCASMPLAASMTMIAESTAVSVR